MPELDVDDGSIHYEAYGEGEPLVLVHGALLSKAMWLAQARHFAREYRVVVLDLRGHGRTGPTGRRRYSIDLFVEDVRRVLRALDLDSAHVCGLSMGGVVAQALAVDHPESVRGLVLSDTVRSVPPSGLGGLGKHLPVPRAAVHATVRALGVEHYYRSVLSALEAAEGRRWLARRQPVRKYAFGELDRVTVGEFLKLVDAMYDFEPVDLASVAAPTLVLAGEHEATALRGQTRRLAAAIPDATRATVPDAGHIANMENPAAFNERVEDFLGRV